MVQKITKWFREKHPNLTLSKERLESLATIWANGVTEETDLNEHLGNIIDVNVLKMLVSADDALRNQKPVEKKEETETDKTDPNKALLDALNELKNEVTQLKAGKVLDEKTSSFKSFTNRLHDSVKSIADATDISNMSDDALEKFKTALSSQSDALKVDNMSGRPKGNIGAPSNNKLSASEQAYIDSKKNK